MGFHNIDGQLLLIDVKKGVALHPLIETGSGWASDISFSSDSEKILATGSKGKAVFVNVRTAKIKDHFTSSRSYGEYYFIGDVNGHVTTWDLKKDTQVGDPFKSLVNRQAQSIVQSPDEQSIAIKCGGMNLWDFSTRDLLWRDKTASHISFSSDSRLMVSSHQDNTVKIWKIAD